MLRILAMLGLFFLTISDEAHAASEVAKSRDRCVVHSSLSNFQIVPILCVRGRTYRIVYGRASAEIKLITGRHKVVLDSIPKGYDPRLVGAERLIGFLPESLQPYATKNFLIAVSAIRTNGGGGGGQCGSGVELYLHFIDIGKAVPEVTSKILIGSCNDSIELYGLDISSGILKGISVDQNNISLHFMNYKNVNGSPTAVVAPDLTRLMFK